MKYLILLLFLGVTDPIEIAKVNGLKREANEAFQNGNYQSASATYSMLADSLGVVEDEILLNLGHSYFNLGDTANAKRNYQGVTTSNNKKLKSIASQQLGVMAKDAQKLKESLSYLKNSIKADPTNLGAKYDYEAVKKMLEQQQQQNQENEEQQNEDQEEQDQENQDQEKSEDQKSEEDKEGEKSEEEKEGEKSEEEKEGEKSDEEKEGEKSEDEKEGEKSDEEKEGEKSDEEKKQEMNEATKQKLKEMNISEDKARMILEALKNNEIQFIQQQKRQPTKKKDTGKPDW